MTLFITYLPALMQGVGLTLLLLITSALLGLLLAIGMTIALSSDHFILKKIVGSIIFFFRGTPLLVQFFLVYYGISQFDVIRNSLFWPLLRDPMICAIMTLSINSASYTTVLLMGAIDSVPDNEKTACVALGMSKWLAFRRIIFPRAFILALPAYSNEIIMLLKSTSLASTITVLELMGVTQQLIAATYASFTFYMIAGLIYLVLNAIITWLFHHLMGFFRADKWRARNSMSMY